MAGELVDSGPGLEVPDRQTAVLSQDAEAMRRPSGLTATDITRSPWPVSWWILIPDSRSQTAVVRSAEPVTAATVGAHRHGVHPPSMAGEHAEPLAGSRSQTATVPSPEPETMCRPSGLTATERTHPDAR